ncbi:hypothetical protein DFH07DRAFT_972189 [Mycena maculata]|uniref:Uncharacterized protein n=1 Tax=Mycena maculata TaxID=230809 RepID=A0AAD7HIW2_9AGAR|nr:hypothetical protein DFH07DRAFT_972189 [Mycena maculata]
MISGERLPAGKSQAITLLVDHVHSIPVKLYAEFSTPRLIDYNLEIVSRSVDVERRATAEMMMEQQAGPTLIIERLGDVHRAIDFAKEQNDDDLWEELLKYFETRPTFIRGLLENVGAEISPLRHIRRIKNGLEISGLQEALIKILQDFHLQISLLEGCQTILNGDSSDFVHMDQTAGFFLTGKTTCPIYAWTLQENPQGLIILFLCRDVHATCTSGGDQLAFGSVVQARLDRGCPVCHKESEGSQT